MKLSGIIYRLFILVAMAAVLSVTGFAKTFTADELNQFSKKIERLEISSSDDTELVKASALDVTNFTIGGDFVAAEFYMALTEDSEDMRDAAVHEIVYLIDKLEDQPEADELQKILRSVIRKTASVEQLQKDIRQIADSYQKRQTGEQLWFYNVGKASMSILVATFLADEAKLKKDLADMQALIKTAPKATSQSIIAPMNAIVKHSFKTNLTEEEYMIVTEDVEKLIESFKTA